MCDSVVVVREGYVLFAKNSDRDPNEAQRLEWHPRREHEEGARVSCTWMAIPQARTTYQTLLSRPYWMWGAEMGANEHGVTIGNEAVFTDAASHKVGLLGMDLLRLALERATSAEEAVEVIRSLLHEHGQGGRCGYDDPSFGYDNSFLVADASGAYVLETVGRESQSWAVPQGVRAISNGLTLDGMSCHADRIRGGVAQCVARRARVEFLARDARVARDLASVLRDHGAHGDAPHYKLINGAMAAPCMHAGGLVANSQTVASWITELRPEGVRHYVTATAAPCLSAYKPVDLNTPINLGTPTGIVDESTWWRFERLHRGLIGDEAAMRAHYRARDAWEEATWDGSRQAARAFEEWREFVDSAIAETRAPVNDARPWATRRYWRARERDAKATTPKLPAR